MLFIPNVQIRSILDFEHGEGWTTFSWLDASGIECSLTIDVDGHCSREMPIRSGTGVTIVSVLRDRVRLRFSDELAARLQMHDEVEFEGPMTETTYADLLRLADYF